MRGKNLGAKRRRRLCVMGGKTKSKSGETSPPNFALERGEETALRVCSPRKTTQKHPARVYAFTRCFFPRRAMRVLSNPVRRLVSFFFPLLTALLPRKGIKDERNAREATTEPRDARTIEKTVGTRTLTIFASYFVYSVRFVCCIRVDSRCWCETEK